MGTPNRDEIKGKFDQVKGGAKETIGRATNDPDLEREGAADRQAGKVKEKGAEVRRKVGDAIKNVGDSIRK
ncbi:MAG TPA: CsbD family protein [Blastocatellia bacterium]|nr:CsbD family protein [Blastocatellia bacterium]